VVVVDKGFNGIFGAAAVEAVSERVAGGSLSDFCLPPSQDEVSISSLLPPSRRRRCNVSTAPPLLLPSASFASDTNEDMDGDDAADADDADDLRVADDDTTADDEDNEGDNAGAAALMTFWRRGGGPFPSATLGVCCGEACGDCLGEGWWWRYCEGNRFVWRWWWWCCVGWVRDDERTLLPVAEKKLVDDDDDDDEKAGGRGWCCSPPVPFDVLAAAV